MTFNPELLNLYDSMKLTFLGASREVGRSAVLMEAGKRLLFDYGVKLGKRVEHPMPFQGFLDAFILSHAHLDHSGYAPALYETMNAPCFATHPTMALSSLLLRDSLKVARLRGEPEPFTSFHIKKFEHAFIPLAYGNPFPLRNDITLTLFDAGHSPGAAIAQVYAERKRVVYTGDFKMEPTRMHSGAEFVEKTNVLITESTYSDADHPDRDKVEKKLVSDVREIIDNGGTVLFPSFAVGRSQELLMFMADRLRGVRTYIDGMSQAATEIAAEYPGYLRDGRSLRKGMKNAEWVESDAQRRKAVSQPGVIISSAGMLEGGPALSYLMRLNKKSKIILTGYQVAGTNARTLWDSRYINVDGMRQDIKLPVDFFDMSAHAGRSDLIKFVKRANPEKVFCIHGDKCEQFAEELCGMGFEAYAPILGSSFEV